MERMGAQASAGITGNTLEIKLTFAREHEVNRGGRGADCPASPCFLKVSFDSCLFLYYSVLVTIIQIETGGVARLNGISLEKMLNF